MLKICCILFLYISLGDADFMSVQIASSSCYKNFPAQLDAIYDEIVAGNKNPPRNMQCFTSCLLQKLDLFVNGRISTESLKKRGREYMEDFKLDNIPGRVQDLEKFSIACNSAIGNLGDECEVSYQFMECLYRQTLPDSLPRGAPVMDL